MIYSNPEHPHTKNLLRADPVNRYHQMQQVWQVQRAPGEDSRKALRWNMREQMLTQYVPERVGDVILFFFKALNIVMMLGFLLVQ